MLEIEKAHSLSLAAGSVNLSQPAATQALSKIEAGLGMRLFQRTPKGLFPTPHGQVFLKRARRAVDRLDMALTAVSPRLRATASFAQLRALVAVSEAANYSLAARQTGLSQPTLHRAVSSMTKDAGKPLFERTSFGLVPTRACRDLARAVTLALAELQQADADLNELDGRPGGYVSIGALPLSRSSVLPEALAQFRASGRRERVTVIEGVYEDLLAGLRAGRIDVLIGALRTPAPVGDVTQEALFSDEITILARPDHPLVLKGAVTLGDLAGKDWMVPRPGTPSRQQFDDTFAQADLAPRSLIETGSVLLMREVLRDGDMLGWISGQQARAEIAHGLLAQVDLGMPRPGRPIGLTLRHDFVPTQAQAQLLDTLRSVARGTA